MKDVAYKSSKRPLATFVRLRRLIRECGYFKLSMTPMESESSGMKKVWNRLLFFVTRPTKSNHELRRSVLLGQSDARIIASYARSKTRSRSVTTSLPSSFVRTTESCSFLSSMNRGWWSIATENCNPRRSGKCVAGRTMLLEKLWNPRWLSFRGAKSLRWTRRTRPRCVKNAGHWIRNLAAARPSDAPTATTPLIVVYTQPRTSCCDTLPGKASSLRAWLVLALWLHTPQWWG